MSDIDVSVEVLVVGGAACGAVAALAAHDSGSEVLVIERDTVPAGSTGMSLGLFCAAGTRFQAQAQVNDSADQFFQDIMLKSRGEANEIVARVIADESAPTLEWLCDKHGFPWTLDIRFRPSYGNTCARVHGWEGHNGLDMVQWLHRRLGDLGVDVMPQTRLVDLEMNSDSEIKLAIIEGGDGSITRVGCGAVILACGGFGANRDMTGRYIPESKTLQYFGHESNEGDAVQIGERLGAATGDMGSYQGYAMLSKSTGLSVPPNVLIEGGILVNAQGERFTDESEDIAGMVLPLSEQTNGEAWVVFDEAIHRLCDYIPDYKSLDECGVIFEASTMEALADRMSVPASTLKKTLRRLRSAQKNGSPDDYGRDWQSARAPK